MDRICCGVKQVFPERIGKHIDIGCSGRLFVADKANRIKNLNHFVNASLFKIAMFPEQICDLLLAQYLGKNKVAKFLVVKLRLDCLKTLLYKIVDVRI